MSEYIDELEAASDELDAVDERIDSYGEQQVRAVADAHRRATELLDRYADSATGTGDFKAYLEFQDQFVQLVESLDDDLPTRDAFEAANEVLDQRRLSESDFDRARELLADAGDIAGLLDERTNASDRLRDARRRAKNRLDELDERVDELERVRELGDADVDAPVEDLKAPVEAYNDAVTEAFESFRRNGSARDLLAFVAATEAYPLVEYRQPPDDLREYVQSAEAGEKSVETLLEYAEYSSSKLGHYVEDTAAFRTSVAVHVTYLKRLGPDPLTVSWPPPSVGRLRFLSKELVAVVGRFADESVTAKARTLRDLTDDEAWYERLRYAAVAREELTERQRERLAAGGVEDDLDAARSARRELADALSKYDL